jgi:hypothetical protein
VALQGGSREDRPSAAEGCEAGAISTSTIAEALGAHVIDVSDAASSACSASVQVEIPSSESNITAILIKAAMLV